MHEQRLKRHPREGGDPVEGKNRLLYLVTGSPYALG